jgi:hypothetical protein
LSSPKGICFCYSLEKNVTIEIHQPELEALIQRRMDSGRYPTVEDALLEALKAAPEPDPRPSPKQNFTDFMMESPLWGSGLEMEREKDFPRMTEF